MEMVPASLANVPVNIRARRRKDPLPCPFATGMGILPCQRRMELDPAGPVGKIPLMLDADELQVPGEVLLQAGRQQRHAVLLPLPVSHEELMRGEVHVLGSQAGTFQQPQAGAIEQGGHQAGRPLEALEDGGHLRAREDNGKPLGSLRVDEVVQPREGLAEHLFVEEQQGAQGLVLGGGGHLAIDGQGRQEPRHLRLAHLGGMALVVKEDEPLGAGR